jgi:DNA-binding NarL/FixJ family response regulator
VTASPLEGAVPARVFLVDDHKVVRTGLAAYLATEPGMAVVGESGDGKRALEELAVLDAAGGLPDVVLMDLQMPTMDECRRRRRSRQERVVGLAGVRSARSHAGPSPILARPVGFDHAANRGVLVAR